MNVSDATKLVIEVVSDIQSNSGRQHIVLTGESCPIGDLPGFDSLNGIEVTTELAYRLGCEFPDGNLLIDETGNRALSIEEIATQICALAETKAST